MSPIADNIAVTPGAGATVATDDVGGVQHQLIKVEFGTDGAATLVSDSDPLPIDAMTMPAAAATTDSIATSLRTDKISNNLTELTPKFKIIDAASAGDNTLVAAVTDYKIRVLAAFLVASGAVTVRFESGAGGTALTGQMVCAANGGFVLPFNPIGWFETAVSTLLNLELSGATSVDGCLTYVEVA